jgi:hypothetical protein
MRASFVSLTFANADKEFQIRAGVLPALLTDEKTISMRDMGRRFRFAQCKNFVATTL